MQLMKMFNEGPTLNGLMALTLLFADFQLSVFLFSLYFPCTVCNFVFHI